ncbi:ABC transporter transmembrane domain-containing protein [Brevibacillus fluminis]
MRPYKNGVLLLCACGFIAAICELLIPKFVQHFLDVTDPAKDHREFVIGIFLILLVLAFKFGASSGKEISQRMLQENTARDLQLAIFQQLRRLGFSYYENTSAGAILTLLNTEVSALQKLYRQYFPELLQNTIFTCISFMLMFSLSFSLTLMFLPCFLLYYLVGPYFEKKASWTAQKLANSQMEFGQKAYESISALTELRASFSQMWDSQRVLHVTDRVNQFFVLRYSSALSLERQVL